MKDKNENVDRFSLDIGDIQARMSEVNDSPEVKSDRRRGRDQLDKDVDTDRDQDADPQVSPSEGRISINIETFVSLLSDVGTGLWRMQKSMVDQESGELNEDMRRPHRHLRVLLDLLQDHGVEVRDHTGERVPESGIYGLKVITYESKDNLQHEIVTETVKPTIILGNKIIQMGEVVVGIPKVGDDVGSTA